MRRKQDGGWTVTGKETPIHEVIVVFHLLDKSLTLPGSPLLDGVPGKVVQEMDDCFDTQVVILDADELVW